MPDHADIAVIGTGAAGLMAAIAAGRAARDLGLGLRIVALDGATSLGAKILVAGGGRCNATHYEVDESAYAGSSRHAIKQVLRAFDVPRTIAFFRDLGVELKREDTGKLFPTTDNARTVLNALLQAARDAGVELIHPWRVDSILPLPLGGGARVFEGGGGTPHAADAAPRFLITPAIPSPQAPARKPLSASRVILATGGRALPKSGSDGHGYAIARSLGHTITPTFPALVPLTLSEGHFLRALSGITFNATIELRSETGKRLVAFTNSTLCTHFGLSGPSVLDISRYYLETKLPDKEAASESAKRRMPGAHLFLNFLPPESPPSLDAQLQRLNKQSPLSFLRERLPERLAHALCIEARIDPAAPTPTLTRDQRRALASAVTELPLPVTGDRGYNHAEATAGGVPLSELHLQTLESRVRPGLHICGELCDVDGRIGGYNFQWAWSSAHVAGTAAARAPWNPERQ